MVRELSKNKIKSWSCKNSEAHGFERRRREEKNVRGRREEQESQGRRSRKKARRRKKQAFLGCFLAYFGVPRYFEGKTMIQ